MREKVFELYSGIGGMHFALCESGIDAEVVKAIDINPVANTVYRLNFPTTVLLEKNIQGLDEKDFDGIDIVLMSPPCQPHTRNGLQKDSLDKRSDSLLHIINLISKLKSVNYFLLENVKGFELSEVRTKLLTTLNTSGYVFQEFLLSPVQFCIPNSRLRYYLLAKKNHLEFCFKIQNSVLTELPDFKDMSHQILSLNWKYKNLCSGDKCFSVKEILEKNLIPKLVPDKILEKYGSLVDIVTEESTKTCCFTKSYGRFVEGTGSVFSNKHSSYVRNVLSDLNMANQEKSKTLNLLKTLELRYFTAKEISRLMCFPEHIKFPQSLTDQQKYKLLGNSINVHVVALLIKILYS